MATSRNCPDCGAPLPDDFRAGGCPQCALRAALACSGAEPEVNLAEEPGDQVGRYELRKKIGEGGCGVVWLAEQAEPLRREVALKVIKLGMDTKEVIARFEAERQVLALMDHPNIARVFDAGATATGRPYFVMELVRGVKITDFCDRYQLSTAQRLHLFVQVCHAVQHSHQKGIIHRDIKPSNVLVTLQDDVPVPKVIDFGIAKATTSQRLTDKTLFTAVQQFLGTPAYMSPEQAGLSPHGSGDIDTRSDIYSLGVLLYELLTGQLPFERQALLHAGLDEMRRVIREVDPPKPSTKLSTLTVADLSSAAERRRVEPPKLIHLVRGDLDWIVMRTLEKDRERRYETAESLALDIGRHLNNEAVLARPPERLYRLRKVVTRNKLAFGAAAVIVLLLVIGVTVSTWQAVRATRAERESAQVSRFLQEMLKGVGPSVALGRDTKLLREILDKTSDRVGQDLSGQPQVEARLRGILGNVYSELGDYHAAEAMQSAALALRKNHGAEPAEVAESLNDLANVYYREGRLPEAEAMHRQALALRQKLLGHESREAAESLNNLGNTMRAQSKFKEAESLFRDSLAIRKTLAGTNDADTAESLENLGAVISLEGRLAEAEPMLREALAEDKKLLGNLHPYLAVDMNNLADTLTAEGKYAEAEAVDRDTLAMRVKLLGTEHPDVAYSLFNLATVLMYEGRLAEAEATNRVALAMRRKLLGNDSLEVAGSLNNLADIFIQQNKLDEAETAQREALAIERKKLGPDHEDIAGSLDNLAVILDGRGRLAEAEATEREAWVMRRKVLGEVHPDVALSLHNLSDLQHAQGKLADAESFERQALAMRSKLFAPDDPNIGVSLGSLADILHDEKHYAEAETLQRRELALWRQALQNDPARSPASVGNVADCLSRLTRTLLADQKPAEAAPLAHEWLALGQKEMPGNWQTFNAQTTLGACLAGQKQFAAAEPLLLAGFAGLLKHEPDIPAEEKNRLSEAAQYLVTLYEATQRPAEAAKWRKQLPAPPR